MQEDHPSLHHSRMSSNNLLHPTWRALCKQKWCMNFVVYAFTSVLVLIQFNFALFPFPYILLFRVVFACVSLFVCLLFFMCVVDCSLVRFLICWFVSSFLLLSCLACAFFLFVCLLVCLFACFFVSINGKILMSVFENLEYFGTSSAKC